MIQKATYICDRCKKEYTKFTAPPYGYPWLLIYNKHKKTGEPADLCKDCFYSLGKWMDRDVN